MKKFFSLFLLSIIMFGGQTITALAAEIDLINNEQIYSSSIYRKESIINRIAFKLENQEAVQSSAAVSPEENKTADNEAINKENTNNEIEVFNHNGSQLKITKSDIDLLSKLVYAESRGEPFQGKVAVASVVLNRVMNPKFPNSIEGVIFQKNAFSCVVNGKLETQTNESCYEAVYEAIKGKDPTNEALFFYNPSIATCSWMKETSKKDSKVIGNHTFFKQ
ncbi:cell wall hydrolase [uncultured Clostridium sp.]|uniref:cell wall hydrolase n=1 Tax=uncultured Clostridium sp. TaxID=59620 RepID=UPI00262DC3A8|nr:cell wall hydrolase [uncultured Clostridium sp.]